MKKIRVAVASKGNTKVQAVKIAFAEVFSDFEVELVTADAPSEIDSQPTGSDMSFRGTAYRLDNLKKLVSAPESIDYWIALESQIVTVLVFGVPHVLDVCNVIVEDKYGRQAVSTSSGVEFPLKAVLTAERSGFRNTTVGDILAKEYPEISSKDPHTGLTGGCFSRASLIISPIQICLKQLTVHDRYFL